MTKYTVTTHADGFGNWHATVTFPHSMSESDPRPAFNLGHNWGYLRRIARAAIVREVQSRQSTPVHIKRLEVTGSKMDAQNCWHSVTFGEPR